MNILDPIWSIINEYVPELYKIGDPNKIISIIDHKSVDDISYLRKYKNLKYLRMDRFDGDLTPLKNAPIQIINMDSFNGDLTPLRNSSIQTIDMDSFNGDLTPLENAPIQEIWMKADHHVSTKILIQQIKNHFLSRPHPRNDIEVWDQELILAEKEKITKAFTIALGSIAIVALIIGGIGLMNMLLVSIAERIHEIGLRKAMGALPFDIFFPLH